MSPATKVALAVLAVAGAPRAEAVTTYSLDYRNNLNNGWVTYGGGSYYSGEYNFYITPSDGSPGFWDSGFCTTFTQALLDPQTAIIADEGRVGDPNGDIFDSKAGWARMLFDGYADPLMDELRAAWAQKYGNVLGYAAALDQVMTIFLWEADLFYRGVETKFDVRGGKYAFTNTSLGSGFVDEIAAMATDLFTVAPTTGYDALYYMPYDPQTGQVVFTGQPQLFAGKIAVPEPGALALVFLGVAGLWARRRPRFRG